MTFSGRNNTIFIRSFAYFTMKILLLRQLPCNSVDSIILILLTSGITYRCYNLYVFKASPNYRYHISFSNISSSILLCASSQSNRLWLIKISPLSLYIAKPYIASTIQYDALFSLYGFMILLIFILLYSSA